MAETKELRAITTQVRRDILRMVHKVNSGHPGGSLGCAEFFVTLYHRFLKSSMSVLIWMAVDEDLFFLSNGHISPGILQCFGANWLFSSRRIKHL